MPNVALTSPKKPLFDKTTAIAGAIVKQLIELSEL